MKLRNLQTMDLWESYIIIRKCLYNKFVSLIVVLEFFKNHEVFVGFSFFQELPRFEILVIWLHIQAHWSSTFDLCLF